jgi:subtilase family serine protease
MRLSIRALTPTIGAMLALLSLPAVASAVPHSSAKDLSSQRVCGTPSSSMAACNARIVTTANGRPFGAKPAATSTVAGYHPADLLNAYNLASSTGASGQTVAIVDAYNDPYAASDVNTYRSNFGLSTLSTCSLSSGKVASTGSGPCFAKVGQTGSTTSLPTSNGSWSQEISLDLDMVSAICNQCNILLVEASSASYANLGTAVNEAASLGANEISNSYGGGESSSDATYDTRYYNHPGVAVTASSGDSGYGVEYPAASQYVTAVGGTTLNRASNTRGWTETAWSGAGSGCSVDDIRPTWQGTNSSISAVCARRAVADVSAVANPNTGVSVYDSYRYGGASGWLVFGGTSVASPITASVYGLAGNAGATAYPSSDPYSNPGALNDVTSGSNGRCGSSALCTARAGWDGPTGLGTPNGTGAF